MDPEPPATPTATLFDFDNARTSESDDSAEVPDSHRTTGTTGSFRVMTWNVNSVRARLPLLLSVLEKENCDAVLLQETKTENDSFPFDEIKRAGYFAAANGQKAYNGVAILSKTPLRDVKTVLPDVSDGGAQARFIEAATNGGVRLICVYVPNGEASPKDPDSDERLVFKTGWLNALADYVSPMAARGEKVVLAGDFNVIDRDQDVYDAEKFRNGVLAMPAVRQIFRRFEFAGYTDAARFFAGENESLYSFWDYQGGAAAKNHGILLDYIFVSPALQRAMDAADILTAYRSADKASDHAPAVCSFNLKNKN